MKLIPYFRRDVPGLIIRRVVTVARKPCDTLKIAVGIRASLVIIYNVEMSIRQASIAS